MDNFDDAELQEIYLEQLKENYLNPKNIGILSDFTFKTHLKNPSCGDLFDLYIKLDVNNKKIIDVKFKGDGCAISTASMSLLSQELIGMDLEDAKKLTEDDVFKLIGTKF